jgi:L,D-peptidoglycan transpeptidase YkuD (ErfK/YbiS/YcfS/YnhG family)
MGALWSDDPSDPLYNLQVSVPHSYSHETLRRPDPLYDLVLITDWNHPVAQPGAGSAIFIHRWRRPGIPTAGCIGFAPQDLLWIAARVALGASVVVRG